MTKPSITMELELDGLPTSYQYKQELRPDFVYYFCIPRIDLNQYADARVKITLKENDPDL